MPDPSPRSPRSSGGEVILGLDPGLGTTGFGVIERQGPSRVRFLGTGVIRTPPGRSDPSRLLVLHRDLQELLARYDPDVVAIERLFFSKNITTGIQVAQARGVLLLACGERQLEIGEYSPVQIKSAVGGSGKAGKPEMQRMVQRLLNLPEIPRPDDAADALAVALCHAFRAGLSRRLMAGRRKLAAQQEG